MSTPDAAGPNLFVVGAVKAGTTSLWTHLDAHPDVFMSRPKEPHFFSRARMPADQLVSHRSIPRDEDVDGVAGAVLNGAPQSMIGTPDYLLEFSDWLPRRRLRVLHGATCNLLLRRELLDGEGFPEDVWPGEDTIVTFRVGVEGRLAFAPGA